MQGRMQKTPCLLWIFLWWAGFPPQGISSVYISVFDRQCVLAEKHRGFWIKSSLGLNPGFGTWFIPTSEIIKVMESSGWVCPLHYVRLTRSLNNASELSITYHPNHLNRAIIWLSIEWIVCSFICLYSILVLALHVGIGEYQQFFFFFCLLQLPSS